MWKVTGKNLALGRLIPRGKTADKRMSYVHVGPKGTTVFTPAVVARVSLPETPQDASMSVVLPAELIPANPRPESDEVIELGGTEPAVSGPKYVIPTTDSIFPPAEMTTGVFTCDADILRKVLTVASEVSKDSTKTIRLRICKDLGMLRIDNYRQPGDQEFCAVIREIRYDGGYIPGEKSEGSKTIEKKPIQKALTLKTSVGRRFRGEGE